MSHELGDQGLILGVSAEQWIRAEQGILQKKLLPLLTAVTTLSAAAIWIVVGGNYREPSYWTMTAVLTLAVGLLHLAKRMTRHNQFNLAGHLIVSTFFLIALTVSIAYADMIVTGAILGLFIALLASVLISPEASYKYVSALLITAVILVYFIVTKRLDPPELPRVIGHIINLFSYAWTLFFGAYLMAKNQARTHKALAQLFDKSEILQTYNAKLQQEIAERLAAQQALTEKADELARANAIIFALNQVAAQIELTTDPDQVQKTVGEALESLGISCLLGWLEPETEDWVAGYISVTATSLGTVEKLAGIPIKGLRIPRKIWEKHFLLDPGMSMTITDPFALMAELFPHIPQPTLHAAVRAAGITPQTPLFYLPMSFENQTIGVAALWGSELQEAEKLALMIFAAQIATAVANARLYQAARQQAEGLNALFQVGTTILSTFDRQEVLETVLRETVQLLNATSAYISEWDPTDNAATVIAEWIVPQATEQEQISDLGVTYKEESLIAAALASRRPILIRLSDPDLPPDWREHMDTYHARSILVLPILTHDHVSAYFEVWESRADRLFNENEILLGQNLASLVGVALDNSRLYHNSQQQVEGLKALLLVGTQILSAFDRQTVLETVLREAVKILKATSAYASVLDKKQRMTTVIAEWLGPDASEMESVSDLGESYPEKELIAMLSRTRDPHIFYLADANTPPEWRAHMEAFGGKSVLLLPVYVQDKLVAYIDLWESRTERVFTETEILLAKNLAWLTGIAMENARLYEQAQRHSWQLEEEVARQTSALRDANEQLRELDRLKSKFIDDISHELRTPITTVGLYLDLLAQGKPEKRPQYHTVLQAQKYRLIQLVEGVIRLTRLDLGTGKEVFTAVNLNDIATEVVTVQRERARAVGSRLILTAAPELPVVQGVPGQLAEAITNLVDNAIHYASGETIEVITCAVAEPKAGVCLLVKDNGSGISTEDLPHVFDRFYRGQTIGQSNIPGIGLGLAIVKAIVSLHKGKITVKSEPGAGTTFRVLLPVAAGSYNN